MANEPTLEGKARAKELREEIGGLQPEEAAVLAMLRSRLKRG